MQVMWLCAIQTAPCVCYNTQPKGDQKEILLLPNFLIPDFEKQIGRIREGVKEIENNLSRGGG